MCVFASVSFLSIVSSLALAKLFSLRKLLAGYDAFVEIALLLWDSFSFLIQMIKIIIVTSELLYLHNVHLVVSPLSTDMSWCYIFLHTFLLSAKEKRAQSCCRSAFCATDIKRTLC